MPLSSEQRSGLQSLIRKHTVYFQYSWNDSVLFSWNDSNGWHGTYITDSIELIMDSSRPRVRDLSMPNSFIKGQEKAQFWYDVAAVASGLNEFYWHEMEYESASDGRKRYVYTWTIGDAIIKFYTKTFRTRGINDLHWYVCRFAGDECNVDSGCDTDPEDVMLDE
jgi:hypothetical protein